MSQLLIILSFNIIGQYNLDEIKLNKRLAIVKWFKHRQALFNTTKTDGTHRLVYREFYTTNIVKMPYRFRLCV